MKSNSYSIKHSAATFAALCLISTLSFGNSSCQNSLNDEDGCNPYKTDFIKAKTNNFDSNKRKVINSTNSFLNKLLTKSQKNSKDLIKEIEVKKVEKKVVTATKELPIAKVEDKKVVSKVVSKSLVVEKIKNNIAKSSKSITNKETVKLAKAKRKLVKKSKKRDFYIVKKGDTLISIAKEESISITKLREINRLSRSGHIRVGQKLYLKNIKIARNTKSVFNINKNIKYKKAHMPKFKKHIKVIATAYTSHRGQTDKTPFLAAWNNKLKPGMKIIAVSHDLIKKYGLTNGVKVKLKGLPGLYTVRDKMNRRFKKRIDIYMGVNKRKALKWGKKKVTLYW